MANGTMELTTDTLTDLATRINLADSQVEEKIRSGLEAARACGELLIEAKGLVRHGEWASWLAENCNFTARTASGYMRICRHWNELKSASGCRFGVRGALESLREPKLPTLKHRNELAAENFWIERAIGALLLWGTRRRIPDVHKLQWLFELEPEQAGQLYCDLNEIKAKQAELVALLEADEFGDFWEPSPAVRAIHEKYRNYPTNWKRLEGLARHYVDDPDGPIGLHGIAKGIAEFSKAA